MSEIRIECPLIDPWMDAFTLVVVNDEIIGD